MNIKRLLLLLIILSSIVQIADAATIHGTVYSWETLEPLPKTIIIINTTPEQRIVSEDGTYSITLPPGSYVLKAFYYKHGELKLYAEENITIHEEGDYVLDIILFPPLTELSKVEDVEDIEFPPLEEQKENSFPVQTVVVIAAIALVGIGAGLFIKRRKGVVVVRQPVYGEPEVEQKVSAEELPDDLKEVLEILKNEGGRITQKELRKRLGYSEAKMSLIIADLERRGLIEKIKKGRGNIIFLKDQV